MGVDQLPFQPTRRSSLTSWSSGSSSSCEDFKEASSSASTTKMLSSKNRFDAILASSSLAAAAPAMATTSSSTKILASKSRFDAILGSPPKTSSIYNNSFNSYDNSRSMSRARSCPQGFNGANLDQTNQGLRNASRKAKVSSSLLSTLAMDLKSNSNRSSNHSHGTSSRSTSSSLQRRSRSFGSFGKQRRQRRSVSPKLPTVEEFQRTSPEEDKQVLESFIHRSHSCDQLLLGGGGRRGHRRSSSSSHSNHKKRSSGRSSTGTSRTSGHSKRSSSSIQCQSSPSLGLSPSSSSTTTLSNGRMRNALFHLTPTMTAPPTAPLSSSSAPAAAASLKPSVEKRLQDALLTLEEELSKTNSMAWPRPVQVTSKPSDSDNLQMESSASTNTTLQCNSFNAVASSSTMDNSGQYLRYQRPAFDSDYDITNYNKGVDDNKSRHNKSDKVPPQSPVRLSSPEISVGGKKSISKKGGNSSNKMGTMDRNKMPPRSPVRLLSPEVTTGRKKLTGSNNLPTNERTVRNVKNDDREKNNDKKICPPPQCPERMLSPEADSMERKILPIVNREETEDTATTTNHSANDLTTDTSSRVSNGQRPAFDEGAVLPVTTVSPPRSPMRSVSPKQQGGCVDRKRLVASTLPSSAGL